MTGPHRRLRLMAALAVAIPALCRAAPLRIVAAESVYGQVAAAIAGDAAVVTSVLTNPGQDPHEFEARPSTARAVADAAIVAENGAGYDPWMDRLLAASGGTGRDVIDMGALLHVAAGANPHLWYDPAAMPAFAQVLADDLARRAPAAAGDIRRRLAVFMVAQAALQGRVAALRARFAGTPVTATEPLFGYMAAALGLRMRNERLQIAVMNGTEPRASDVAAMQDDLRQHRVRALIYNTQVTDAATARLVGIARASGVPLVGITETLPPGQSYTGWMMAQLGALEQALSVPR